MLPDLFSIGQLTVHTYGLFVAIGFMSGILITIWMGRTYGISSQQVMDMGFIMILTGVIGSRLAYVIINFSYYRGNPIDIFLLWHGGLVFSGGLIAVFFVMVWYVRRHGFDIWQIGDLWSPAAAIGQAIGRIGCFMAGCCYGKPTDVPWAVMFTNPKSLALQNIPIHPTQLYSSFSGLIIFIILILINRGKSFHGQVFLWFLILHSTTRLFLERFRGDDRGLIFGGYWSMTQLFSIIILIAAVVTLFLLKPKKENS